MVLSGTAAIVLCLQSATRSINFALYPPEPSTLDPLGLTPVLVCAASTLAAGLLTRFGTPSIARRVAFICAVVAGIPTMALFAFITLLGSDGVSSWAMIIGVVLRGFSGGFAALSVIAVFLLARTSWRPRVFVPITVATSAIPVAVSLLGHFVDG
jgi:hypothetical protein